MGHLFVKIVVADPETGQRLFQAVVNTGRL
jgi:hypothetical protein